MSLRQVIYADFSLGYNDTMAAIAITDKECVKLENATCSAEVKSLRTRNGSEKVNSASFVGEATDGYSWTVGSVQKNCVVIGGKVYELDVVAKTLTEKITLTTGAKNIYPFVVANKMYFGDGSELYVWGDVDYNSEIGVQDIAIGDIVKNNGSDEGVIGNYYQSKVARTVVDLPNENYLDATKWTDVTDVRYFGSSVVRKVKPYDPATAEVVLVTITSAAAASGTLSLNLDGATFTCAVTSGDSVPTIVNALYGMTTTGWTKKKISNSVKFTKNTTGLCENGYLDPGATGVGATYQTITEGKTNDNDLAPIRKCTIFAVHPTSYRVFAAGNPDDNGLFYGEIGQPTYFKSAINKIYPMNGFGQITALCSLSKSLLASYFSGWYAWSGITPLEDATWDPLNLPYGCVCHNSIVLTPYSFTFLSNDGIYTVSASILSSEAILLQGKDIIKKITENRIEKTIKSIKNKSKCRGIFFNNTYYLAYNTDGENNDKILSYEWDTKSFGNITGWKVNQWLKDESGLYFCSKNYILKVSNGFSDVDVETGLAKPINLAIKTKEFTLGNPLSKKLVKFIGLIFKQNGEEISNVTVTVNMGYESFSVPAVDLAESLIWGRKWGSIWGYRESIVKMIELNRVSDSFQIEITNGNIDDPATLIGVGFVYEDVDFIMPNILKEEALLR